MGTFNPSVLEVLLPSCCVATCQSCPSPSDVQQYKVLFSPSPTHCNWSSSSIDCLKAVWHSKKLRSYPLASAKLINIILGKLSTQLPLVSVLPQDWHTSLHLHRQLTAMKIWHNIILLSQVLLNYTTSIYLIPFVVTQMATFWNSSCSMTPSSHRFSQDKKSKNSKSSAAFAQGFALAQCFLPQSLPNVRMFGERTFHSLPQTKQHRNKWAVKGERLQSSHLEHTVMRGSWLQYRLPTVGQLSQPKYVSLEPDKGGNTMGVLLLFIFYFTKILWYFEFGWQHLEKKYSKQSPGLYFPFFSKKLM